MTPNMQIEQQVMDLLPCTRDKLYAAIGSGLRVEKALNRLGIIDPTDDNDPSEEDHRDLLEAILTNKLTAKHRITAKRLLALHAYVRA